MPLARVGLVARREPGIPICDGPCAPLDLQPLFRRHPTGVRGSGPMLPVTLAAASSDHTWSPMQSRCGDDVDGRHPQRSAPRIASGVTVMLGGGPEVVYHWLGARRQWSPTTPAPPSRSTCSGRSRSWRRPGGPALVERRGARGQSARRGRSRPRIVITDEVVGPGAALRRRRRRPRRRSSATEENGRIGCSTS